MEPEVESCGLEDIGFKELLVFCAVKLVPALVIASVVWFGVVRAAQVALQLLLGGTGVVVKG